MNQSVDLTDLRSMTDGDVDLETVLFEEFIKSTESYLNVMSAHCVDGANEIWRSTAHALKGISYNLGARIMGDLCKQAQEQPAASAQDKTALLNALREEYARVKDFLAKVHT